MPSGKLLAKRRVDPTWLSHPYWREGELVVETFGPEVSELCAEAGFAPDPEQELILDLLFALGPDGKSAVYEADIIGPRQNFKTGLIKQAEIGWLYVTEEQLIVHSAHELSTTEEAFNDLRYLIEDCPRLARWLDVTKGKNPGISEGNGRWAIHLRNPVTRRPQRIKYKARTKGGGRGLTGNKVVLDEAFALEPSHLGSLEPTLAAVPDPQLLSASSAGRLKSEVLRDKRRRGRAGLSPRQMYVEYGDRRAWEGCLRVDCDHRKDAIGCAADDEARWEHIMPALDRRVQRETIRSMRQSMPVAEFLHEFMVWWEDPDPNAVEVPAAIDLTTWSKRAKPKTPKPEKATIVIDVSPDRRSASIGIAADGPGGRTLVMEHTAPGTAWVVSKLQRLKKKRTVLEVALATGQAAILIPDLIKADIDFETLTAQQMGASCGAFQRNVNEDKICHLGQDGLDVAVQNAITRYSGEVEFWDRRDPAVNISPVVACAAAAYRWEQAKDNEPAIPSATYVGGRDAPAAAPARDAGRSGDGVGWRGSGK